MKNYLQSFLLYFFLILGSKKYGFANASGEGDETEDTSERQHPPGPKILPTTWVVTATTHMPKQLAHALAKDLSKQANYMHWTCYRQEPVLSTDKLHCCQEIYQLQERDPFHLCWTKRGCQRDKVGRSEFMHFCTEQIVQLDLGESDQSIEPRFSLLVAPQLADLPSDTWRQFVSFDASQGGHWMYVIESPFRLAMDPKLFFASADAKDDVESSSSSTFEAKLSSEILPDPDDDEDFRDLKHQINIALPSEIESDHWTISLMIVHYLPEAAGLRRSKNLPTCQSSVGKCHLDLEKDATRSLGQQSVLKTTISLSDIASSTDVSVELTYSIALDDDNIILPAPFIFSGSATPNDGDSTLAWKASAMEKIALPTSFDERDELWKVKYL